MMDGSWMSRVPNRLMLMNWLKMIVELMEYEIAKDMMVMMLLMNE
jgi:hypothetical protein